VVSSKQLVDNKQQQFAAYFLLVWRDTEASPWTEGGSSDRAPLTVLMACWKGILVGRNVLSYLLPRFGDVRAVFCLRHYRSWQQFGLLQVLLFRRSLLPPSSGVSGGIGLQNVGTCVPLTHGVKSHKTWSIIDLPIVGAWDMGGPFGR